MAPTVADITSKTISILSALVLIQNLCEYPGFLIRPASNICLEDTRCFLDDDHRKIFKGNAEIYAECNERDVF